MSETRPAPWRVALALATLWFVWGSTYLAVTHVLPAVPPFVMSAARFAVAGPVMALAAGALPGPRPTARELLAAAGVGCLLFVGGNGGTVFAQTHLTSGMTAVLVGLVPLWIVVLGAAFAGERPHPRRIAGVVVGFVGLAGLVGGVGGQRLDPIGVASVGIGSLAWATGSLLARRWTLPKSLAWSTAAQMSAGSVGLLALAGLTGQTHQVHLERIDGAAVAAFAWLVGAGSLAAVVAYNWLLRVTAPSIATTYAYVNPLVAVWLGWWLGGEALTTGQLGWSLAIVAAVALVTTAPAAPLPARDTAVARAPSEAAGPVR